MRTVKTARHLMQLAAALAHRLRLSQRLPLRLSLRKTEGGSMEGGTYADITYLPMLFALMVAGLFFALVGFYRVGGSYAAQMSAQVGAVAPDSADETLTNRWQGWTGKTLPDGGFELVPENRSVSVVLDKTWTMDYYGFGPWGMPIQEQSHSRSERFYPGGPVCDGDGCDE